MNTFSKSSVKGADNLNKISIENNLPTKSIFAVSDQLNKSSTENNIAQLQEFIVPEKLMQSRSEITSSEPTIKVLDMGKIQGNSTSEIIKDVSNYIMTSKIENADQVELNVNHDILGKFKIVVNKNLDGVHLNQGHKNQAAPLDVMIVSQTNAGKEFFVNNRTNLISTLGNSGFSISEFKIDSSNNNFTNDNSNFQGKGQNNLFEFTQDRNRREDSQRRQELWDYAMNREFA